MDSIAERLTLLTLDNKHRTLTEAADLRLGYGLCGALLLDLLLAGALQGGEGECLTPNPDATLDTPHLQEAFAVLPSYSTITQLEAVKQLYAVLPRLKAVVLDRLVAAGAVREDTAKIKWSFAFKSYMLQPSYSGYRQRLLEEMRNGTIRLEDSWVLQIADASGLLWAEDAAEKKPLQAALKRLHRLEQATGQLQRLTAQLATDLPEAIARSHKLPKMGKKKLYDSTWEWRGFWLDKGPTLIQASEHYKPSLEQIAFSEMTDAYVVIEGVADNIKCRKSALEVKTPLETLDGHTAFSPKRVFAFPLSPRKLATILPQLEGVEKPVKNAAALCSLLNAQGIRAEQVEVKKKRFQIKLQSCVKVEFCSLLIGGRKYLSACVEGPEYDITAAHSHNFQMGEVMEMGYVEFLKHCQMEQIT